jgi:hypothetical protein
MTQSTERYLAQVVVKSVKANFPPGSGYLIQVEGKDGRSETQLHFQGLVKELQDQAKTPVAAWPGTSWEYDFFEHRLIRPSKS